jgi:hypothetical protein
MPKVGFTLLPFPHADREAAARQLAEVLSVDAAHATTVFNQSRVKNMAGYLADLGVRSMMIEYPYTDSDYLDAFAAYYAKCHTVFSRWCKRLHFFEAELSDEHLRDLESGASAQTEELLQTSYRGFIVARPLPEAVIGRSLLATYPDVSDAEPMHKRHFPVLRNYEVNLCGIKLIINSIPFQEQDTVLAACATVALWTCFHKTADLFHTPVPGPVAITRTASQLSHYGRPIPSTGLEIEEICTAIRAIELEPELYDLNDIEAAGPFSDKADGIADGGAVPFASLLYGYLAMQLPVLLVVTISGEESLHAIAVTGYSELDVPLPTEYANREFVPLFGRRIHEFYGHDDQICPFSRIGLAPAPGKHVKLITSWPDKNGKARNVFPRAVIVPVYNKIRLRYTDVLRRVERLDALFMDPLADDNLGREWDLHLILSNDYKRKVREEPFRSHDVRRAILSSPHPRFWWRAVLSIAGEPVAELLFDATGIARSIPLTEIIWINEELAAELERGLTPGADESVHEVVVQNCTRPMFDFVVGSLRRRAEPFSHITSTYGATTGIH